MRCGALGSEGQPGQGVQAAMRKYAGFGVIWWLCWPVGTGGSASACADWCAMTPFGVHMILGVLVTVLANEQAAVCLPVLTGAP